MTMPTLRVQSIHKRFGATVALSGVDLSVDAGQVMAVVGENGAGKSTLMKVLSGAHQPDRGQMWLNEALYQPANPLDARKRGVSMIYQELSLANHLSVMENILLGMEPTIGPFYNWKEVRRRAVDALHQLGRNDISPELPVKDLSIADRQLVEIARAIAVGCKVLVLDEPTSSLTASDIHRLFTLIRRLRDQGHAIIYISHFMEEIREISDCFTVLRDGQTVGGGMTRDTPMPRIVSMMVGRDMSQMYPRTSRARGEVLLHVDTLSSEPRLKSASLQLHRGEVLGIAGVVGAGRSELLRSIFGLDEVQSGRIRVSTFSANAIGPNSPAVSWNQGIGMVSEDRKMEGIALNLSIADNLTMSRLSGFGPDGIVIPSQQHACAERWIDRLAIKCRDSYQSVGALSGGNQQKIAIARLLHHDCDVLLLDEPTRGIDVGSKAQIYQLINDLACGDPATGRRPRAVLMVSSYLPELLGVCDRIAVMCRGRLHPARDVGQLDEHQIMLEATGADPNAVNV